MHRILVSTQSRYPVSKKKIKDHLVSCLAELKVKYPAEVSIVIVGDRKMRDLNLKYRDRDKTTNVLSFPASENREGIPFLTKTDPSHTFLGDILVSYPQALVEAAAENKMVDRKILELLEHGLLHLLGHHHPEN